MVLREPRITVLVKGVVRLASFSPMLSPEGELSNVQLGRPRVDVDALGVLQAARVGDGELELDVGGILVVRGGERSAGDVGEVLHRVGVAVGRAVVHDDRPRQGRRRGACRPGRRCPCLLKSITSPTFQVSDDEGEVMLAVGGVLPGEDLHGGRVRGAGGVGDLEPDGVGARPSCRSLLGCGRGRVVVGAVVVEVPGVAQRVIGVLVARAACRRSGP